MFAITTTAYSTFSCMYTGLGNVNLVAVVPSVLVFTELGFNDTSEKGNIFCPG